VDGQKSVKEEYYVLMGLGSCGEQRERGCPAGSWNKNTHLFFYFGHYLGVKMVADFCPLFLFRPCAKKPHGTTTKEKKEKSSL
jgi:hypothetical protein